MPVDCLMRHVLIKKKKINMKEDYTFYFKHFLLNTVLSVVLVLCLAAKGISQNKNTNAGGSEMKINPSEIIYPSGFGISSSLNMIQESNIDSNKESDYSKEKEVNDINNNNSRTDLALPDEFYIQDDLDVQTWHSVSEGPIAEIRNYTGQDSPAYPTDPVGAVGPDHYVQAVNWTLCVYNKSGSIVTGPIDLNKVFDQNLPGASCNDGDPIVLYDEIASRWILTAVSKCENNNHYIMFAISKTKDPTGQWYSWSYKVYTNDYLKVGVGKKSYVLSVNNSGNDKVSDVFALDRDAIINGESNAKILGFNISPIMPSTYNNFHCLLPVDHDGVSFSSAKDQLITIADDNQGNDNDELRIYDLIINWDLTNPENTAYCYVSQRLPVKPFTGNFNNTMDNIPQPNTNQKLHAISEVLMHRAQCIKVKGKDKLVCVHTIAESNNESALRWYELERENVSDGWSIAQQSTYNPDNVSRWNPSIAISKNGIIFLGYSVSNGIDVYPGIRFCAQSNAARVAKTGMMDLPEKVIWEGSYSQYESNRWGDYSSADVDFTDFSFWYTNCYMSGVYLGHHKTRIARIFYPFCISPSIQASNLRVNSSTSTSVDLSWDRGDGDGVLIVVRNEYSAVTAPPVSGKSYIANSKFGLGDDLGHGNYVVYAGEGSSINITNLEPGFKYYVSFYEYLYDDGSTCYLFPSFNDSTITRSIHEFPYHQTFDSWEKSNPEYTCTADGSIPLTDGWVNIKGDDIDFDVYSGKTPSTGTGPGNSTGNYIYAEASNCFNRIGIIQSPSFDFTGISHFDIEFDYHMYGSGMGSLAVECSTDGGVTWSAPLWKKEGDQGDSWNKAIIPLDSYQNASDVRFRFIANTGSSYSSDIAIDKITVRETEGYTIPYLQTFDFWNTSSPWYSCTPDGSVNLSQGWKNITGDDIDWDIYTGSTKSSWTGPGSGYGGVGNYLYLEASSCTGKTGYLESPVFHIIYKPTLKFYYHMFDDNSGNMGSLSVEISLDNGNTWQNVWSKSGNQGNQWNEAIIELYDCSFVEEFLFRFKGVTGDSYLSDIAIDHVSINYPCDVIHEFPYEMDFDNWTTSTPPENYCTPDGSVLLGDCWLNDLNDDFDWDVHSGPTTSTGTGPSAGYEGEGNYLLVESSYCFHKKASIRTPIFDLSNNLQLQSPELSFYYHMHGEDMGSLMLFISTDGGITWDHIYTVSGNQGDKWNKGIVNLSEYLNEANCVIKFMALTGRSFTSDIALDKVCISNNCDALSVPYIEGFETFVNFESQSNSTCNYNGTIDLSSYCWYNSSDDDFDWGVGKGATPSSQTGPSSGYDASSRYLYTEVSGGGCYNSEASVFSPEINLENIMGPMLFFKYHMYGYDMGTLSVEVSTNNGNTWIPLWEKGGNQGDQWNNAYVYLTNYAYSPSVKFKFKAISGSGWKSDIAIDKIEILGSPRGNTLNFTHIEDENVGKYSNDRIILEVSPNPNNGVFTIEIKSKTNNVVNIKVFNNMGIMIYQKSDIILINKYKDIIDLSGHAKGIYYIIVEGDRQIEKSTVVTK